MTAQSNENVMEKVSSLAKRRGFIFPGSDIYGGLAGTWDYGPLGVELRNNIKAAFWRAMVYEREDTVGFDGAIMMAARVWEGSGHTEAFTDPLVECKVCHKRFRADHPDVFKDHPMQEHQDLIARAENVESGQMVIRGQLSERQFFTEPRRFNLLVEAKVGAIEGEKSTVYLRGEITQSVHVNFKNILDATHRKLPFGVVQTGRAFRNEITPSHLTFRSREFEQMELQFYVKPDEEEAMRWFEYWKDARMKWYCALGMNLAHVRFREHAEDERAHYARAAWDIEYESALGWKELEGIHHRGGWDLTRHSEFSGKDLSYYDEEKKERYIPWAIETSGGVDRAMLFFLMDAYQEETDAKGTRIYLKLHPRLAPYKIAVFPLVANKEELVARAREVYTDLKKDMTVAWDDRGNIGKRYYAQDEIGTPYCVTVDYQTLEDGTVTVRDRDTTKQERVAVAELGSYLHTAITK